MSESPHQAFSIAQLDCIIAASQQPGHRQQGVNKALRTAIITAPSSTNVGESGTSLSVSFGYVGMFYNVIATVQSTYNFTHVWDF